MERANGSAPLPWFARYLLTAETTLVISGVVFFLTGYQDLITRDDLKVLAPYVRDKPIVTRHIDQSESALEKINTSLAALNERITAVNHEHDIRISRLEATP